MIPANWALLADHLWQSTLFAAAVWLVTLLLKQNRAHVRYWLWLTASVKFLVPFGPFVALGRQFRWEFATLFIQPDMTSVIDTVSQPFSAPQVASLTAPAALSPVAAALPFVLFAVWFSGCAMHVLAWWVRWRRVAVIARTSLPLDSGRELDALRRLEPIVGIGRPTALVSSDATLEPAVFGIWTPVLLWPQSFSARLGGGQLQAILAHELCHVRRRDNLAVAVHMLVEAVFWFHPLVWWLETRLIDERERACDEEVIRLGNDPQLYAESILKTCEFCAESPLVCVAGVTGSDLKKRIEAIMRSQGGEKLNAWKTLLLAAVGIASVATPIIVGVLNSRAIQAQTLATSASDLAFEVASIKPNKSASRDRGSGFQPGGRFLARNMTLRGLIAIAYGEPRPLPNFQIVGGPSWVGSDGFDIEAKAAVDFLETQAEAGFAKNGESMLRTLLAERFKLVVHKETRDLPVYALVMASRDGKLGSQVRSSSGADCVSAPPPVNGRVPPPDPNGPPRCGFSLVGGSVGNSRHARVRFLTMDQLAKNLENSVARIVLNRTGLAGSYSFDLEFTPGLPSAALPDTAGASADSGPSIFTALQEQLGLRLESTRGPVEVLVIDSVQRPTSDDVGVTTTPTPSAIAQSRDASRPAFEVASIKPNKSDSNRVDITPQGGRFTATNVSLGGLIRIAYGTPRALPLNQLSVSAKWIGGPGQRYLESDRFDVVAKAEGDPSPAQMNLMIRTLLADRFKLVVHHETKQLPMYALVLARTDGRLGPRLRRSEVDCSDPGNAPPPAADGTPSCGFRSFPGKATGRVTMSALAQRMLSNALDDHRPVEDRTGLAGTFEFDLEWTPDRPAPPRPADAPPAAPIDPNGASIFTALQEQLGLKLEPQNGQIDTLVVDSAEQPTPD